MCTSATIIDHIWSNDMENYICSGILYTYISDHFPVLCLFSSCARNYNKFINIKKREYNSDYVIAFRIDLEIYKWDLELPSMEGVDTIYDAYIVKFMKRYNHHFPVKSFLIKEKHYGKQYITPAILKSIKNRNIIIC